MTLNKRIIKVRKNTRDAYTTPSGEYHFHTIISKHSHQIGGTLFIRSSNKTIICVDILAQHDIKSKIFQCFDAVINDVCSEWTSQCHNADRITFLQYGWFCCHHFPLLNKYISILYYAREAQWVTT